MFAVTAVRKTGRIGRPKPSTIKPKGSSILPEKTPIGMLSLNSRKGIKVKRKIKKSF